MATAKQIRARIVPCFSFVFGCRNVIFCFALGTSHVPGAETHHPPQPSRLHTKLATNACPRVSFTLTTLPPITRHGCTRTKFSIQHETSNVIVTQAHLPDAPGRRARQQTDAMRATFTAKGDSTEIGLKWLASTLFSSFTQETKSSYRGLSYHDALAALSST